LEREYMAGQRWQRMVQAETERRHARRRERREHYREQLKQGSTA
jgi:hypothetical protein